MNILYAVQGTGNGHMSRAIQLYPFLKAYGKVDFFVSGSNLNLKTDLPIVGRSKGISLFYKATGGLDYLKILKSFSFSIFMDAYKLPVKQYDLVINDFDFVTSLACLLRRKKSVQFGHQASFQSSKTPRSKKNNFIGEFILKAESSVAAGVRRVEAVVGEAATLHLTEVKEKLHKQIVQLTEACAGIAAKMNTTFTAPEWNEQSSIDVLNDTIQTLQNSQKELAKKLESQEALLVNELFEQYKSAFTTINDIEFLGVQLQLSNADHLKKLALQLNSLHTTAVVILTAEANGKANVALSISESLVNSKNWHY